MGSRIHSAVVVLVAALAVGRVSRAQGFDVAAEYPLPQTGLVWAAADFDADGDMDIATVTSDGAIATALNDGHGVFTVTSSGANLPVGGTFPTETYAVAGDFNQDGAIDLLVTSSYAAGVTSGEGSCLATLSLNLGNGSFAPGRSWAAVAPLSDTATFDCGPVEVGDFDGDGTLDFVLEVQTAPAGTFDARFGVLNLFSGNGDGTFAPPRPTQLSAADEQPWVSHAMKAGDFNGDGVLDLALGENISYLSGSPAARMQLWSRDVTGQLAPTFTAPLANLAGTTFTAARAADINGDGRLDLLLVVSGSLSGGGAASVLPVLALTNGGDGTFSEPVPVAQDLGVIGLESADFDADGKPDLVVVSNEDRATFLRGDGRGEYAAGAVFATGGGAVASLAADFNGDGRADLAMLDPSRPAFRVALTEPAPFEFPLPRVTALSGTTGPLSFTTADINGDGKLDLVSAGVQSISVLLGGGDGRFTPDVRVGISPLSVAPPLVADLNHDGRGDLVVPAPDGGFRTLFGNADGSLSGTTTDLGNAIIPLGAFGDVDADGDLDLAVFNTATVGSAPQLQASVRLYTNDGAGKLTFAREFAVPTLVARLAFADLNGDSHLDLFVGAAKNTQLPDGSNFPQGDSLTFLGDGTGSFTQETALSATAQQFELGDVDGDRRLDLVMSAPGVATSVARGNGDGTFAVPITAGPATSHIALSDVDADGKLDLVTVDDSLGVAHGNGDGTFQPSQPLMHFPSANPATGALAVSDVTGDGEPDLMIARLPQRFTPPAPSPEIVTVINRTAASPPPRCPEPPRSWPPPPGPAPHHLPWWRFGFGHQDHG